jgi:hypothetical protein
MKKLILLAVIAVTFTATQTFAQSSYKTALGLGIDFGDGSTLVGPSVKHFFSGNDAGSAELTFGADAVWLGAYYQYHQPFPEAKELKWYIGVGPQFAFRDGDGYYDGGTAVLIRPQAGLDYKVKSAPISLTFDWRPMWQLNEGSGFEAARFGLGFRYTFK